MTWDSRWMEEANLKASWSKDRSTKVGAVIVGKDNRVIASGWNGFPRGCDDEIEERHERPLKYKWAEHAERNACYNAAAKGYSTEGATIYCTMFPCVDCARGIIQCGIKRVVTPEPDWSHERWGSDFKITWEMLSEVEVEINFV